MNTWNGKFDHLSTKRVCVLLSGGVDSSVLAAELAAKAQEVLPVYVRSGLVWEEAELHWVEQFLSAIACEKVMTLKEIQMPVGDLYDSHWSTTGNRVPDHLSVDRDVYLPGRNLILLPKTSLFCALNGIPVIALGPLKGNPFPDSTPEFFSAFRAMASGALSCELEIITPFVEFSKTEVIRIGKDLPLHLTFSCINPAGHFHCGACNKCAERRRSFMQAGVEDKTQYRSLPELRP